MLIEYVHVHYVNALRGIRTDDYTCSRSIMFVEFDTKLADFIDGTGENSCNKQKLSNCTKTKCFIDTGVKTSFHYVFSYPT